MSSYNPTMTDHNPTRGEPMNYVNVYEVARRWGGPEEGGWWYDTGTVVTSVPVVDRETAEEIAATLRAEYPNTGRSSSVLGGADYRVWVEDNPGADYPTERPRYE
jgi:hypothetical protein